MIGGGGRRRALWFAMFWIAVGVGAYVLGVQLELGQRAEDTALDAAEFTYSPPPPLNLVSIPAVAIALGVVAVIALLSHGIRRAIVVTVIPVLAIVASQLLKQVWLTRPQLFDLDVPNTFPSGHMTVFTAVTAALVWAVPTRARGIVAVGGAALLAAVGWQLLAYGWHRPSDVLGGIALGTAAFALACLIRPATSRGSIALGRTVAVSLLVIGWLMVAGALVLGAIAVWNENAVTLLTAGELGCIGATTLASRALLLLSVGRS
ncbi:phosphatase PAP2 family protein [Leucobacter tenebrionis]|uniref:phosphatase PAP2 family protein n=1 Tax=Leucobacter tenebrionis TaxID=2873270 RepID=UPI001CA6BEEE|nr:phosphatase PAP2 family protein [Leucobacter tenebrionis]QZY52016.1 phosphatase PAP2 family protein [Leucobacter tenebrionis]